VVWGVVFWAAVLMAMSWAAAALAEGGEDGDGFDGDEHLSIPLLIGLGLLAAVAWSRYRRGSPRSQK
jgi:hypothetical protein